MTGSTPHVLFVNSGILGQTTFARFVDAAFVSRRDGVRATQIVVAAGYSPAERALRRALCQRLWRDGRLRNIDFFRFRAELNAGLVARRRIRRLLRGGERFDVLHFHHQSTAYANVGLMKTTPSIVSVDCTQRCVLDAARTPLERWTYRPNVWMDGEIFRAAKLIVSPSEWAARSVAAEYPDCGTPIEILPTPVELEYFDPRWADERFARASAPGYRPRVLFVGGDFERKGGVDLLDAWRTAGFADRASLDLVTSAPIDARRLPAGVHVHAGVRAQTPEWVALWRAADVFVLPTRDEALGIVFQEAAAAGLPQIGTRINAVPELIDDGVSGVLVPPRDPAALAAALGPLLSSAERRREFGTAARRCVVARADARAYRDRLVTFIQRLVSVRESLHAHPAA